MVERYGGAFSVKMPFALGNNVVVTDPALIKQVLTAKPDVLLGGKGVSPTIPIYGDQSMFVLEEPEHLRRRRLLIPGFNGRALERYGVVMREQIETAFQSWPLGEPFSFLDECQNVTLDIIIRVIFGVTDPAEIDDLIRPLQRLLHFGVSEQITVRYMLRRVGALNHWPGLRRTFTEVDRRLDALIRRRRAAGPGHFNDVLSVLIDAVDEDGERLTDKEIHDDLITLLLAGHETSANTLAWCMWELLTHPAALQRVRQEAVAGGDSAYTEAVIQEVLRMHPPVVATARVTATRYELGPWVLPENTWILLHIYGVSHREDIYDNPGEFRPERFLDTSPGAYSWLPFGGGIKRCLGAAFATLEIKIALHVLLAKGQFDIASDTPEQAQRRGVVLRPRHKVPVILRTRIDT